MKTFRLFVLQWNKALLFLMKQKYHLLALITMMMIVINPNHAQEKVRTVKLKAGSHILLNDSIFIIQSDTIITVLHHDELVIKDNEEIEFYLRIKRLREKNRVTNEIINLFIKPDQPAKTAVAEFSENLGRFLPYSGMTIRNIRIRKTDIIGQTVYDTIRSDISLAGKLINETHVYTKDATLRNNIFFNSGDSVNPWLMADNEHHLRSLSFIENALIYFVPVDEHTVDLLYVVKDKIPYGLLPVYHSAKKQSLRIWNANLMGYGRRLSTSLALEPESGPALYLSGAEYGMRNIGKSFIDGKLQYGRSRDQQTGSFLLNREFIPGLVHMAYGMESSFGRKKIPDYYLADETVEKDYAFSVFNSWIGYQLAIGNINEFTKRPVYFIPALGVQKANFFDRPYVSADSNRFFSRNTALLASFSLSSRNFLQTSSLFVQGIPVDLPYGYSVSTIIGYTFNEFETMPYSGIDLRLAKSFGRTGYFIGQAAFGTHIKMEQVKQGALDLRIGYISPAFSVFQVPARLLASAGHLQGINRLTNDSIYLRNSETTPGLRSNELRGFVKSTLMVQMSFYLPNRWLGFNMTPYLFFNSGIIADNLQDLSRKRSINGIGAGIRLRNEYLIFNSIQFRLVYYPYTPADIPRFSIDFDETDNLSDFRFSNWIPNYIGFK